MQYEPNQTNCESGFRPSIASVLEPAEAPMGYMCKPLSDHNSSGGDLEIPSEWDSPESAKILGKKAKVGPRKPRKIANPASCSESNSVVADENTWDSQSQGVLNMSINTN